MPPGKQTRRDLSGSEYSYRSSVLQWLVRIQMEAYAAARNPSGFRKEQTRQLRRAAPLGTAAQQIDNVRMAANHFHHFHFTDQNHQFSVGMALC